MNESEKKAQLIVQHGAQKGKKFDLKKQIVLIGSDSSNDIRISGEFVSPKHAQFQLRDDGIWMIRNESINGTLLNQKNIDIKPLQDKDVIQIGSQTLLRFEQTESKKTKKIRLKNKTKTSGKNTSVKQIAIAIGLTIYLGIMGVIFFSSDDEHVTETLSKADIEQKVSKQELLNCLIKTIGPGDSNIYIVDKNDFATEYHMIRSKAGQEENEEEIEQLLESIIEKANKYFFNAWVYEQQKDWNAAIKSYQQVERLIPDIRCPSTVFVQSKIKQLINNRDE